MSYFIYLIRNKINGNLYVGKAKDPEYRFKAHKMTANKGPVKYDNKFQAIHAAMRKHGIENFEMKIVAEVTLEILSYQLETEWILCLRQNKFTLYNKNNGGLGGVGFHHTEKTKSKMSKTRRGKPVSTKTKDGLMKFLKGKTSTNAAWRKKVSDSKIGEKSYSAKLTEANVRQIKIWLKNNTYSQKEIAKIFNIDSSSISNIKRGKTWSHIIIM